MYSAKKSLTFTSLHHPRPPIEENVTKQMKENIEQKHRNEINVEMTLREVEMLQNLLSGLIARDC